MADNGKPTGSHYTHRNCDPTHDQQYWLYAAVDSEINGFLHVKLYPTRTTVLIEMFLRELRERNDVQDAVFIVDPAPELKVALHYFGL